MFDLVKKLLIARQLEMERGSIKVLKNRMTMFPSAFFAYLLKVSKDPIKMGKECYYAGKLTTYNHFTYLLEKEYGLVQHNLEKWMKEVAELGGWGEFDIINANWDKKEAVINIKNSPLSEFINKTTYSVDHVSRGATAGAISLIFRTDVEAIETKCVSKGDIICEFIVKPKEKFSFKERLVKEQLYTDRELQKFGWLKIFRNNMKDVKKHV
jgi:predicted hydrocarbon binding protein